MKTESIAKAKNEIITGKKTNWAMACVKVLKYIQKAARYLNLAFYFERKVPHYNTLLNTLECSFESELQSINIIEKELCIYKSFAKHKPDSISHWGKTLAEGENEFYMLVKEREETHTCHLTGLRFIAKKLLLFVTTPHVQLFIEIHNELLNPVDGELLQLFHKITIQVKLLKN
ncbi:MAG: hypothetical protein ACT4ON_13290 [Bacteroidota bacterium]